jgi:hypothetical protein
MYVPDEQTTTAYRDAIVAMGFSAQHAALVQVDVTQRAGRPKADMPLYRVTTGTEVMRRGEKIRRALMLWYVYDHGGVLEEAADRDAIATMLAETVSYLPGPARAALPPLPSWATALKAQVRRAA